MRYERKRERYYSRNYKDGVKNGQHSQKLTKGGSEVNFSGKVCFTVKLYDIQIYLDLRTATLAMLPISPNVPTAGNKIPSRIKGISDMENMENKVVSIRAQTM